MPMTGNLTTQSRKLVRYAAVLAGLYPTAAIARGERGFIILAKQVIHLSFDASPIEKRDKLFLKLTKPVRFHFRQSERSIDLFVVLLLHMLLNYFIVQPG